MRRRTDRLVVSWQGSGKGVTRDATLRLPQLRRDPGAPVSRGRGQPAASAPAARCPGLLRPIPLGRMSKRRGRMREVRLADVDARLAEIRRAWRRLSVVFIHLGMGTAARGNPFPLVHRLRGEGSALALGPRPCRSGRDVRLRIALLERLWCPLAVESGAVPLAQGEVPAHGAASGHGAEAEGWRRGMCEVT